MTEPRTVTLPTLDHGQITIPEPAWCAGHDGHPTFDRRDLSHTGPFTVLELPTGDGPIVHIEAAIETRPFTEGPHHGPHLWLNLAGHGYPSTPAQVDAIAAALVEHAQQLRHLARRLSVIIAGGEGQ